MLVGACLGWMDTCFRCELSLGDCVARLCLGGLLHYVINSVVLFKLF